MAVGIEQEGCGTPAVHPPNTFNTKQPIGVWVVDVLQIDAG